MLFHKVIKGKRHQNHIASISDEDENVLEGEAVANQFLKYFQKFLGEACETKSLEEYYLTFEKKIDDDEVQLMTKDVTNEEI